MKKPLLLLLALAIWALADTFLPLPHQETPVQCEHLCGAPGEIFGLLVSALAALLSLGSTTALLRSWLP